MVQQVTAPDVSQSGAPVNTPVIPEAFGGTVLGKGLEEAGAAAGQTSDMLAAKAEQFQALNNKTDSDAAWQANNTALNQFFSDYTNNVKGKAAYDQLPGAMKTLEEQRDSIGATLTSPMARAMYDADSRRSLANITGELSRYAGSEVKAWRVHTQEGMQEAARDQIAANPDSLKDTTQFGPIFKLATSQAIIDHELGTPPDLAAENLKKTIGGAVSDVVLNKYNTGDPAGAMSLLEEHKDKMLGSQYTDTLAKIKPGVMMNEAFTDADAATNAVIGQYKSAAQIVRPEDLVTVKSKSGASAQVDKRFAANFQALIDDLDKQGYPITSLGGYDPRNIAGTNVESHHAQGAALDINPTQNTVNGTNNLPANISELAKAHGLGWGGDWQNKKDYMHFSIAQNEGGTVALPTGSSINSATGGAPTSADILGMRDAIAAEAKARANARYPNNAMYENQVISKALADNERHYSAAQGQEDQTFAKFAQTFSDPTMKDFDTGVAATPGGMALLNTLPGTKIDEIRRMAQYNANTVSVPDQITYGSFKANIALAKATGDPSYIAHDDVASLNVSPRMKSELLQGQAEVRGRVAAASDSDKAFQRAWQSPLTTSALAGIKLGQAPTTDPRYMRVQGMMEAGVRNWIEQTGKPPTDQDVDKVIRPNAFFAAGQLGYAADKSSDMYNSAVAKLKMESGVTPNDEDIGRQMELDRLGAIDAIKRAGRPVTEDNVQRILHTVATHRLSVQQ